MQINPLLLIDGYKADHRRQYPEGTTMVYSNWTPRKSRLEGVDRVVFFGLQYFLRKYLQEGFDEGFFSRKKGEVCDEYKATMDAYLGKDSVPVDHIADLHDLGYLPLSIKAVEEGTFVDIGVPMLTVHNTLPEFFWLTNQIETLMSSVLWTPCTSATIANQFRREFQRRSHSDNYGGIKYQGHDFSFRGMSSPESAAISGSGHLTSFAGTDTVPAIKLIEKYYPGNSSQIGASVPATEHSVMCMGGQVDEIATYKRLLNEVYPSGIVSIVSDTWDFWSIMTTGLQALRDDIALRYNKTGGTAVFRPDSGDPVKIICGDPDAPEGSPEHKGAFQCLWDVFGGKQASGLSGLRQLHPAVGLIYGDSITLDRQSQILNKLLKKGFEPTVVLGIGSYTYQYTTRDTFGFAMKATYGEVNGEGREIFKSPKTDPTGEKKSAKGLLRVVQDVGMLRLEDQLSKADWLADSGLLKDVFANGAVVRTTTFDAIRNRLYPQGF